MGRFYARPIMHNELGGLESWETAVGGGRSHDVTQRPYKWHRLLGNNRCLKVCVLWEALSFRWKFSGGIWKFSGGIHFEEFPILFPKCRPKPCIFMYVNACWFCFGNFYLNKTLPTHLFERLKYACTMGWTNSNICVVLSLRNRHWVIRITSICYSIVIRKFFVRWRSHNFLHLF